MCVAVHGRSGRMTVPPNQQCCPRHLQTTHHNHGGKEARCGRFRKSRNVGGDRQTLQRGHIHMRHLRTVSVGSAMQGLAKHFPARGGSKNVLSPTDGRLAAEQKCYLWIVRYGAGRERERACFVTITIESERGGK